MNRPAANRYAANRNAAGRIDVRRRPGHATQGLLTCDGRTVRVALGRSSTSALKREGDGATPIGTWRFRQAWHRADRTRFRATLLPTHAITATDGWCDASGTAAYNKHVRLPHGPSHEVMARDDRLYDQLFVLDHNEDGHRNMGSAVFVHQAREGFTPTEGCVALAPKDFDWLRGRVGPGTRLVVHR